MINASKEFRAKLKDGSAVVNYADVRLSDGTVLHLEPKDFMIGGCQIEDRTTDGKFGVGFAIGKTLTMRIANHDERFSTYDFYKSIINLYVALLLDNGKVEKIRKGVYYTTVPETPGNIIEISAVDGMYKLDRDYASSTTIYPASLQRIITDICLDCGIPIGFTQFDNMSYTVKERPEQGTYRQILSYACQIAGYNARIDNDGYMRLVWYNTALLDAYNYNGGNLKKYLHDTVLDGGNFKNYSANTIISGGSFMDAMPEHIYRIKSINVHTDDVQITGVRVVGEDEKSVLFGEEGYPVEIKDNPFTNGKEQEVANYLGARIVGMVFRPFSAEILNNPLYEPYDVVRVSDDKGNTYYTLLNSISYKIGDYTGVACETEDPIRAGSTYVSAAAQAVVEARRNTQKQISTYDKAVQNMNQLAANAMGLFGKQELQENGSYISYESDRPITVDENGKCHFETGSHVWKKSDAGFFVSDDGGKTYTAGFDKNNNAVLNVLYAIGIVADWIKTGRFEITKDGKTMVLMDFDTGQVILRPDVFELSSGKTIDSIAQEKADTALGDAKTYADTAASNAVDGQTQEDIFDKLFKPNGVKIDGIELRNGKIYISATYIDTGEMSADRINGGTLTLGGKNNQNGILCIKNASNTEIGRWDKDGINAEGDISLKKNIEGEIYTASIGSVKYDDGILSRTSGGLQINGEMVAMENGLRNCNPCILQTKTVDGYYTQLTINPKDVQLMHYYTNPGAVGGDIGGGGFIAFKSERDSNGKSKVYMNAGKVYFRGDNDYGVYIYAQNQNSSSTTAAFTSEGGYYRLCRGTSSSKRYKNIKRSMDFSDIENLYGIQPVIACFKDGILAENDIRNGMYYPMFVAEDVEKYFPEAVDRNEDGSVENWNEKIMIPAMFQMIKSQKETIDNLTDRICRLESLLTKGNE